MSAGLPFITAQSGWVGVGIELCLFLSEAPLSILDGCFCMVSVGVRCVFAGFVGGELNIGGF